MNMSLARIKAHALVVLAGLGLSFLLTACGREELKANFDGAGEGGE